MLFTSNSTISTEIFKFKINQSKFLSVDYLIVGDVVIKRNQIKTKDFTL